MTYAKPCILFRIILETKGEMISPTSFSKLSFGGGFKSSFLGSQSSTHFFLLHGLSAKSLSLILPKVLMSHSIISFIYLFKSCPGNQQNPSMC